MRKKFNTWFSPRLNLAQMNSLVCEGTVFNGDILSEPGYIVIKGVLNGSINFISNSSQKSKELSVIIVESTGTITSSSVIEADYIYVVGVINANVNALKKIIIAKTGKVVGDVTYNKLETSIGCSINGNLKFNGKEMNEIE